MAALLTPLLTNPETVLSPRKTLALIAARAAEQEAATAIKAAAPADVPAAFIKHLAAAVEQTHAAPTAAEAVQPPVEPKAEVANIASEASDAASEFPFTGVWAANQKACTPQLNREGYLPTIINEQGAWAGETTCAFKSARQEGDAVIVTAACSDPHKRWRSQVRLSVAAGRLIWKSQSGTRAYVRCEQGQERTRVAEVRSASR